MTIARRRLLQGLAVAGSLEMAANAQPAKLSLDVLRNVSMVHGSNLSDSRLQILMPALERRLRGLQALRSFEFDDAVGLTQGILI